MAIAAVETNVSGTKGAWAQITNRVEGADMSHDLRWMYAQNGSLASRADAGWVDDIICIGDIPDPDIMPDIDAIILTSGSVSISFLGEAIGQRAGSYRMLGGAH